MRMCLVRQAMAHGSYLQFTTAQTNYISVEIFLKYVFILKYIVLQYFSVTQGGGGTEEKMVAVR